MLTDTETDTRESGIEMVSSSVQAARADSANADRSQPCAVVHVDLDGSSAIYRHHGWAYEYADDPLFASGMKNMLAFLKRNDVRATMFTIGSDVEDDQKREWLIEAVRQGHEIASHSLTHPHLSRLSFEEKRTEIAKSRELLTHELDTTVNGFRAPGYEIDRDCLELLERYGYTYDSSAFPTPAFARRLNVYPVQAGPDRTGRCLTVRFLKSRCQPTSHRLFRSIHVTACCSGCGISNVG